VESGRISKKRYYRVSPIIGRKESKKIKNAFY